MQRRLWVSFTVLCFQTIVSAHAQSSAGTVTLGQDGNDSTETQPLNGSSSITKTGSGTSTLTGSTTLQSNSLGVYPSDTNAQPPSGSVTVEQGTLNVSGTGDVSNNGYVIEGRKDNETGNVTITHGGQVNTTGNVVAGLSPRSVGKVTVDGKGSTLQASGSQGAGEVVIGNGDPTYGSGQASQDSQLNISHGGSVSGARIGVANFNNSRGVINVSGDGSTLHAGSGGLYVNGDGSGAVNVSNGAIVNSDGQIVFGMDPGQGQGTLNVGNKGLLIAGNISGQNGIVANSIRPQFTIDNGTLQNRPGSDLTTGVSISASGKTTVNTLDRTTQLSGSVTGTGGLVKVGVGTLMLTGPTSLQSNQTPSYPSDATAQVPGGSVTVDEGTLDVSTGGSLSNSGYIVVGRHDGDNATLSVTGGGKVNTTGNVVAGFSSGSSGTITVDGQGSSLQTIGGQGGGQIIVGNGDTNTTSGQVLQASKLDVDAGSQVSANGVGVGGNGTINVNGQGSTLNTGNGGLNINGSGNGTGTVNIANGGTINSNGQITMGSSDGQATGNLNIGQNGTLTAGDTNGKSGIVSNNGNNQFTINGGTLQNRSGSNLTTGVNIIAEGQANIDTLDHETLLSGSITGPGSIDKLGTGTLYLTGSSSLQGNDQQGYPTAVEGTTTGGSITVEQGTLNISGTVSNNGYVVVGRTNGENPRLLITNSGQLNTTGNVVLGLSSGSSGTLTVDGKGSLLRAVSGQGGGQISVGNGDTTYGQGTGPQVSQLNITNGGQVAAYNVGAGNYANGEGIINVSGQGSLLQVGAGGMYVNGDGRGTVNISDNGVVYNNGQVVFGVDSGRGQGTININKGGLLVAADVNGQNGIVVNSPNSGIVINDGTLTSKTGYNLTSNTNITTIGQANFNVPDHIMNLSGSVSGTGGINKLGDGTLILSGYSPYSGTTQVAAGTLDVEGTLANTSMMITGTGRLTGSGMVGDAHVVSGAEIGPSGGVLSVQRQVLLDPGSVFLVHGGPNLTGTTVTADGVTYNQLQSDFLQINGTAIVNGATIALATPTGTMLHYGQAYHLMNAAGGIVGHFNNFLTNLVNWYTFLTPNLYYSNTDLYLLLGRSNVSFSSAGNTRNEKIVGAALDRLASDNTLAQAVGSLNSVQARHVLDTLAGEIHASARTALIQDSFLIRQAVLDRLESASCGSNYRSYGQGSYDLKTHKKNDVCEASHAVLWGQSYGSIGQNAGNANASLLHHSTTGFILGGDAPVGSKWRVGGLVSYGYSMMNLAKGMSASANSNNFTIGGYAGAHWGRTSLKMGATYTWGLLNTNRNISAMSYGGRMNSHYLAGTAQAFAEVGYNLGTYRTSFEPFANLAYVNMNTDSYHEHGSSAALTGKAMDTGIAYATFGFRSSTHFQLSGMRFSPHVMAAYRHAFGDTNSSVHQMLSGTDGGDMDIGGVPLSLDSAVVDFGLSARLSALVDVDLSYIGQYGGEALDSGAIGSVHVRF